MSVAPAPTLSREQIETLAERLREAEDTAVPIDPLTAEHPSLSVSNAYAVQRFNIERRVAEGSVVRGHKIGLTAKAMQAIFGIDEPDYGHLMVEMFELEDSTIAMDRLIAPRVEIEPAFILRHELRGPGATIADVIRAVEFVLPSIEVIDSRVRNWEIGLADTIADNGSSARVVLGGRPRRLTDVDLRRESAQVYVDDVLVACGTTRAVLGNPLAGVAWLANALGAYGVVLDAGHVVLPGTPLAAVPVASGNRVSGCFSTLGDVAVSFA
jgi:2-keto-4-pentenoate hydratase